MGILKPRTTSVLIYQGDDLERMADLRRAVEVAERRVEMSVGVPRRDGDAVPSADVEKAAFNEFVDGAAERAVEVRLTAVGRNRWRDLLAEHAPRTVVVDGKPETVEDDAGFEVNTETFPLALLTYNRDGVKTVTGPDLSAGELRSFLEDEVSEGDFERLWTTAYWLNRAPGEDPRLGKFSTATPSLTGS